jgi:hypothetical protein
LEGAAERAQAILDWMEEGKGIGVKPDVLSYGTVAESWMRMRMRMPDQSDAAMKAGRCLYKVVTGDEARGQARFRKSFSGLDSRILKAVARSDDLEATNLALSIFENLEKQSKTIYRHVLGSLSKISAAEAAKKASEIVSTMNDERKGTTPALNIALSLFARNAKKEYSLQATHTLQRMEHMSSKLGIAAMRPDIDSYNLTLATLAKNGGFSVGTKALEILERMIPLSPKTTGHGDATVPPNEESFVLALSACAAARDDTESAVKAESVLNLLEEYNNQGKHVPIPRTGEMIVLLMASWQNIQSKKAQKKVTQLYESALKDKQADTDAFNIFLEVAGRNAKDRATLMLDHISTVEKSFHAGDVDFHPDATSYDLYLNALSYKKSIEDAREAHETVERMKKMAEEGNMNVAPTLKTYSSLISACRLYAEASDEDKLAAMAIAIGAYKDAIVSKYVEPNNITFQRFLLAFVALTPANGDTRNRLLKMTFKDCCRHGQVDDIVLSLFRTHITKDLFSTLIKGGSQQTTVADLPAAWSQNAKHQPK